MYAAAHPGDLLCAATSDHAYRIPALRGAEARGTYGADTYLISVNLASTSSHTLLPLSTCLGSCHTAETGFVLGNLSGPDAPQHLPDRNCEVRASFACTGHLAGPGHPNGALPHRPTHAGR
ncbi:hypothetical protein ADK86_35285 [Streptomyces sp. NRRL F-5755]|uniref:hypothetical protein n=1 Tax=Streptomyces sp. NRRL F-5755 TaxID=1519475 RepID=UPI0006AEE5C5|nr:hypothetical protein [Streptomyces sp. NRRL F-5755]KOT87531.1 hypothetical protein ADK86_35285 [Streptomyces sp. NRRL F-5755]